MPDASGGAGVGQGMSAAAKFTTMAGELLGGQATGKMYEYQAGVAQARARVDEQNAIWAEAAGEENALRAGMRGRFAGGQIRAGQGASNVGLASPSSTAVRAGQTMVTQMDESQIRTNAARKAYGYRVEEAADVASAGALSTASATARTSSYWQAAASFLGGTASVADKWAQYGASFGSGDSGGPGYLYQDPNTPSHDWTVTGYG